MYNCIARMLFLLLLLASQLLQPQNSLYINAIINVTYINICR
jgi:hypothetical protein